MDKKVRIGVIGLGNRGYFLLEELMYVTDAVVTAVCDVYDDRVDKAVDYVKEKTGTAPKGFLDYKELIDSGLVDGVVIATCWNMHSVIAVYAMEKGVYAGMEVGGAASLDECYRLLHTQEKSSTYCMMLENCCYGRHEMALSKMVKLGVFGEVVHCNCGYLHDLRDEVLTGIEKRHYRLDYYITRNGENYPTHGVGPMAKILNINRGNRFVSLVSMASKSRGLKKWVKDNLAEDHPLQGREFNQGDVITTMIKCANGETLTVTLNTCLPRPYSRYGKIQGTNAVWEEDGQHINIEGRTQLHYWEDFNPIMEEYEHPLWKEYQKNGVRAEGHGGMDFLVLSAFVECVGKNCEPPIDIYDTLTWMSVTYLSEQSIALGSMPVAFPDFTDGQWIKRKESPKSKYSLNAIYDDLFDDSSSEQ